MAVSGKRLAFLKDLRQNPPFWFHRAVMFCRFERSQLRELLEGLPESGRYEVSYASSLDDAALKIKNGVEHGLLEPIFYSVAQFGGDPEELMKILISASHKLTLKFPWMFLAYLGTRSKNTRLVKACVKKIQEQGTALQADEVGMSYRVCRFLVNAGNDCTEDERALLTRLSANAHGWTFVHLASAYGHTECLEILLNQPRNQNLQVLDAATELEGFTPLHLAAFYGHADVAELLLKHADKFSSTIGGMESQTHSQQPAVDSSLITSRSIPRDRIFKRSPLHYASLLAFPEVVALFIKKWGSEGVDLPDRFGITSLHCAVAPAFRAIATISMPKVWNQLLKESRNLSASVTVDFAVQQAALQSFFLERERRYMNETSASTLLIPIPAITEDFFWSLPGFTALHCAAIYRFASHYLVDFFRLKGEADSSWLAEDFEGLNPLDYANYRPVFKPFFDKEVQNSPMLAEAHHKRKIFVNRGRVAGILTAAQQKINQVNRLRWTYEINNNLLSGEYVRALKTVDMIEMYLTTTREKNQSHHKDLVDDAVWDHLEWALDKALQHASESTGVITSGPRLHPFDAEEIVLCLVKNQKLHGKSPKQRCLQWAIGNKMAKLAEEIVKDTECELLRVVPGGEFYKESPLARASKSEMAKDMPGLLAAMELREDVTRRCFEDRQVYVDYANTLLVGAVLIAGLAFAAWLQPPRGYENDLGVIDMKRHGMRVFVCSNILSFFLAMGTVVAGASGAMPFAIGVGQLISARDKLHWCVVIASMLLPASIICLAISFSYALLAILPRHYTRPFQIFMMVNGLCLCCMLVYFYKRLQSLAYRKVLPSPARRV